MSVRRAYVTVGNRQVHYRHAGAGPPVVLLHESPRSSRSVVWLVEALADRFEAIALDTPGYGGSDRLASSAPEVADYASATAEALAALGLDRVALYGVHTGAAIALELADIEPERISGVVLDGLPLFTDAERAERLARYAPAFAPRDDGAHMLAMWARQRDHFLFHPWYRREAAARRIVEMPSAQALHDGVMDILRAGGDGYATAYAAAFRHRAQGALARLMMPVLLLYRDNDVLADHRARLGELGPDIEVAQAADDGVGRISGFLAAHASPPAGAPAPRPARIPGRVTRDYGDTGLGQLLVRRAGGSSGRPLVMLHASPGSADALVPLMGPLADRGLRMLALDTLGNGESDKPPWERAEIADYVPVILRVLDDLGEQEFDLYGSHTGAHIALEVALAAPGRVGRLVIDGMAMFEPDYVTWLLDNYTPALTPRDDGTHLIWAWNFVRDQTLFWPWFDRTPGGIRRVEPMPPDVLHRWYVEVLKSGQTYPIGYRAAFRHRARERLGQLRVPALMIADADDMLLAATLAAATLAPDAVATTVPADPDGRASTIAAFLDGST